MEILAQCINSLAIICRMLGKYEKAEPLYLRAHLISERIFFPMYMKI
jgi:hypothetical protein